MVASNALEVLKNENELLNELTQRAEASAQKQAAFADNLNFWKLELSGYRTINDRLINLLNGKNNKAFDDELKEEIALLEGLRNSIKGNTDAAKYWKEKLRGDIEPMQNLLLASK